MGTADLYGSNDPFQVTNWVKANRARIIVLFYLGFKMLTEFLLTRGCRDPRNRWPTVPRQKISSSRWTDNLKKPSLCKINPKFPIELVLFFPLALLKAVAMKGSGGPPPLTEGSLSNIASHIWLNSCQYTLWLSFCNFWSKRGALIKDIFLPPPRWTWATTARWVLPRRSVRRTGQGARRRRGRRSRPQPRRRPK